MAFSHTSQLGQYMCMNAHTTEGHISLLHFLNVSIFRTSFVRLQQQTNKAGLNANKCWNCLTWGHSVWFSTDAFKPPSSNFFFFLQFWKSYTVVYKLLKGDGDRYCALFLPFSHLILVLSTSFSCSRHCCTTPPPPDRMQSLASQQIMWRTRVLTEDEAMSHKGPLRVPDYDNIRKRKRKRCLQEAGRPVKASQRITLIF